MLVARPRSTPHQHREGVVMIVGALNHIQSSVVMKEKLSSPSSLTTLPLTGTSTSSPPHSPLRQGMEPRRYMCPTGGEQPNDLSPP
jgi:hypothetical protein